MDKVKTLKINNSEYQVYDATALHYQENNTIAIGENTKAIGPNSFSQGSDIYKDNAEYLKNPEGKYYVESETCELAEEYPNNYEIINKESLESIMGSVILTSSGGYCLASDLRNTEAYGTASLAAGQGAVAYSRSSKAMGYRVQTGNPQTIEQIVARPEITSLINAANAVPSEGVIVTPIKNEDETEIIGYSFEIPFGDELTWTIPNGARPYLNKIYLSTHNGLPRESIKFFTDSNVQIDTGGQAFDEYNHIIIDGSKINNGILKLKNDSSSNSTIIINDLRIYATTEENVGQDAYAIGADTAALGNQAFAGGWLSDALGYNSFAFGAQTQAKGYDSFAIGDKTIANGSTTLAIGKQTIASGYGSISTGGETEAKGQYSMTGGYRTKATNNQAIALGAYSEANGKNSIAAGFNSIANKDNQVVIGQYNEPNDEALFVIGNGSSGAKKNIFVVNDDGSLNIADKLTINPPAYAYKLTVLDTHDGWLKIDTNSWEKTGKYENWMSAKVKCSPGDKLQVTFSNPGLLPYYDRMVVSFLDKDDNPIIQKSSIEKTGRIEVPLNSTINYAWISFFSESSLKEALIYRVDSFVEQVPRLNMESFMIKDSSTKWQDKNWVAFGTSITAPDPSKKRTYTYVNALADISKMNPTNKGIGSGGITKEYDSGKSVLQAIENFVDTEDALKANLITLEVGANDLSSEMGTYSDVGTDTYCGCLNKCLQLLQEKTNAQILVIPSPNNRTISSEGNPEKLENATKCYEYAKLTRECCEYNCVPFLGLETNLGFRKLNVDNSPYIFFDHVDYDIHQSYQGAYILASTIWEKLRTLPLFF